MLVCPNKKNGFAVCLLAIPVSSTCVSQLAIVSFFCHSDELVMLQQLYDISLLLICVQMIVILTKSVNRCFEKNPKFDMTPLLGGTDIVFSSLIHSFSWFVSLLCAQFVF